MGFKSSYLSLAALRVKLDRGPYNECTVPGSLQQKSESSKILKPESEIVSRETLKNSYNPKGMPSYLNHILSLLRSLLEWFRIIP